uniref:COG2740: Predicted nucleic-acid-binding protein implicated in transcription termination n=1 Tax=uncultured Armatimonadetes bacterium TaxID=157466 RepID=A0A6J4HSC5_9BACT|nr:COG2740: Predicted nucleic-acid-binding protein implicated in transcription termination [uncultured Armatimonadetes bacterium]
MTAGGPTDGAAAGAPAAAKRRVPVRTCVACRTTGGKRALLRVVRLPEGQGVALDPTGKRSGRGAYVCPTAACVALALKQKKLERSLKTPIPDALADALRAAGAETAAADA